MFSPAEIEGDLVSFVGDEGQNGQLPSGDFEIPAPVGIGIALGIPSAAREWFVGHADDVVVEVVQGIAKTPFKRTVRVAGQIPFRRHGIVSIFEPPDGI